MRQKYFGRYHLNVININGANDIRQDIRVCLRRHLFRTNFLTKYMLFSKSFGYALRGILYIAMVSDGKSRIHADEIALQLSVPRHFLGKIMKKVVKHGILDSTKGLHGGFSLNEKTLSTPLLDLVMLTDGKDQFETCVLRLRKCNSDHPCPLHHKMETHKKELFQLFFSTTIGDLLYADQPDFIKSLSTI